jgi:hypothetical protein
MISTGLQYTLTVLDSGAELSVPENAKPSYLTSTRALKASSTSLRVS